MTADVEDQYIVAQGRPSPTDENGCLVNERITCRPPGMRSSRWSAARWNYVDISPPDDGVHRYGP